MATHWGQVMHICISKQTIIGSDNGLSPGRSQAIIWTNARILWIQTLGTNFSEISSETHTFSFKKMHLKMSSVKWWQLYFGLNVSKWNGITESHQNIKETFLIFQAALCLLMAQHHYMLGHLHAKWWQNWRVNVFPAELLSNLKIYLYFLPFLDPEIVQVVEIQPGGR